MEEVGPYGQEGSGSFGLCLPSPPSLLPFLPPVDTHGLRHVGEESVWTFDHPRGRVWMAGEVKGEEIQPWSLSCAQRLSCGLARVLVPILLPLVSRAFLPTSTRWSLPLCPRAGPTRTACSRPTGTNSTKGSREGVCQHPGSLAPWDGDSEMRVPLSFSAVLAWSPSVVAGVVE